MTKYVELIRLAYPAKIFLRFGQDISCLEKLNWKRKLPHSNQIEWTEFCFAPKAEWRHKQFVVSKNKQTMTLWTLLCSLVHSFQREGLNSSLATTIWLWIWRVLSKWINLTYILISGIYPHSAHLQKNRDLVDHLLPAGKRWRLCKSWEYAQSQTHSCHTFLCWLQILVSYL